MPKGERINPLAGVSASCGWLYSGVEGRLSGEIRGLQHTVGTQHFKFGWQIRLAIARAGGLMYYASGAAGS
jgi:hypothetical protein